MEQSHVFNLEAYKERIGFDGDLVPNLEVLTEIQRRHVCSIPFENLSILLRQPVEISPTALEQKLVFNKRGGYCFEQNGLMLGVLSQIGFEVTPMAGRVRLDRPRDVLPPRTHLFLNVKIDGENWIFDAGVGGFSLTTPIRRIVSEEQSTIHDLRRITLEDGVYFHQALVGEEWKDVYEYTGEEMREIDREVSNWWTSTSPNAKFSQNLMAALALPNGERIGILNDRFIRRQEAEILETVIFEDADHIVEVLDRQFNLSFPLGTRFGTGPKPWPTE